jgi:hypothetical protein
MANYKCNLCGAEADSKCISQRNVFPQGDFAKVTHFDSMCSIQIVDEGKGRTYRTKPEVPIQELHINMTVWEDEREPIVAIDRLMKDLTRLREYLPMMLCKHKWELQDAKCDLGCCTRKETSDNISE